MEEKEQIICRECGRKINRYWNVPKRLCRICEEKISKQSAIVAEDLGQFIRVKESSDNIIMTSKNLETCLSRCDFMSGLALELAKKYDGKNIVETDFSDISSLYKRKKEELIINHFAKVINEVKELIELFNNRNSAKNLLKKMQTDYVKYHDEIFVQQDQKELIRKTIKTLSEGLLS